jgi:ribosome-binding factor A
MNSEDPFSTRQSKVARLLQKELGDYFQREAGFLAPGKLITVTVVRVSPDLSYAKVFLSIFPNTDQDKVIQKIIDTTKTVRLELGRKIRNQVRIIPDLTFQIDDSMDYFEKIDSLLKKK